MPFDAAWEDGQTAHSDWLNAVETTLNDHQTAINALGTQVSNVFQYRFASTQTAPPGTGQIRYNAASPGTTKLWVHGVTDDGVDISLLFPNWAIDDQIYLQLKSNADSFNRFDIVAAPIILVDYVELTVVFNEGAGTAFVGNNQISMVRVRKVTV